jgi:hypothetical protein
MRQQPFFNRVNIFSLIQGHTAAAKKRAESRIRRRKVGPTCWQSHQMALIQVEKHSVLTPVVAIYLQVKLAPGQRMKGMCYSKMSLRNVRAGCS